MSLVRPAVLLAPLLLFSCSHPFRRAAAPGSLRNANVLIVTLDTTRADHMGAYGYGAAHTPAFDALAEEGLLFEHCITPTAYTLPSHSSIMTGLYPPAHGVRLNGDAALPDSDTTLAERLAARGYRTGAFVGAFVLDGRWGLSQGFQHYDDQFHIGADQKLDLARVQRPGNQVVDAALKWLDAPDGKPFFAWVHLYDAHEPYEPPEPFKSMAKNPYDGEIAFADSQVARLLAWLDQKNLKDNTIVVVIADHGEGLGDHGEQEHGYYVYDYAVHVPLVIRIPGVKPARIPAQVRTIDVTPTIVDLVAGGTPADMQGASLLPLVAGEKEKARYAYSESVATKLQYGWAGLYGLRSDDYKYIDAPRAELYALQQDPKETNNRFDADRRTVVQLRNELTRVREDCTRRAPKAQEANIDQETMRKLASLGYLGGGSTTVSDADEKSLADPKDRMHLFDSVGYAANLLSKSDYKQGAHVLEIVLQEDPNIPQAQLLLESAYRNLGRIAEARAILDAYLKKDPGNTRALLAMAELMENQGKDDDVLAICKRALAEDGRNARAYEIMADVYMARNDSRQALPLLQKVVDIQPKLTRSRNNLAAALIATGESGQAEQLLQTILREYPKFPLANYHLGLLREQQGRPGEAIAAYQTEVKNHPDTVAARFNLGDLMLRLGNVAGAEAEMRTLVQRAPAEARPYLILAQIVLSRGGNLPEVESLAQSGLQRAKEPDLKALGYFLLADVYSREGRRGELQQAVQRGNYFKSQIRS